MKKFIFMLFACLTLSFASCGNKTTAPVAENDTTVVDSIAADTAAVDSTICLD